MISREDLVAIFQRSYFDPVFYVEHVLRVNPRAWQRRGWEQIRDRMAKGERHIRIHARTCHGAGKTFFAAGTLLWWTTTRPESRGLTTAPSWAVVEGTLWPEIVRLYNGSLLRPLRVGRMLDTELQIRDAWYAVGAASDKPAKLEGHHSPTAAIRIIDEMKAVDPDVVDSTQGMLDAPETLDLGISTPSVNAGAFFDLDTKGGERVIRIVVTVDDLIAEGIPGKAEWKAECAAKWGETSPTFRARCFAEYLDDAEGALFPLSWIERAMTKRFSVLGRPTLGFDVAGSSDGDESAVAELYGPDQDDRIEIRSVRGWQERDTQISKGKVLAFARDVKAKKVRVDVIGIGKGVKDALEHEKDAPSIEEYRAADKPHDGERFVNRKAEDAWSLRDRLEKGIVQLPADEVLREQLAAMKFEITATGKIRVVDPADSPDRADACLIAAAGRGKVAGAAWLDRLDEFAMKKRSAA